MEHAFSFAEVVLTENAVGHLKEINCAVLGDIDEAIASVCEEPVGSDDILSYADKYVGSGKGGAKAAGAKTGTKTADAKSSGRQILSVRSRLKFRKKSKKPSKTILSVRLKRSAAPA